MAANNKGDKVRLEATTLIEGIREADLTVVEGVFATLQDAELSAIANLFQAALESRLTEIRDHKE